MAQRNKPPRPGREPSLKDQIAESGETPEDPALVALREDRTDRRYLGREFLTWLVFHADQGGDFTHPDVGVYEIKPGGRVGLRAMGDGAGDVSVKGAAPTQLPDVRYCITGGLTVRDIELFFIVGEHLYQVAVGADLFDLKRVKLPKTQSDNEHDAALLRLDLIDRVDSLLQVAYDHFLMLRLSSAWTDAVLPRMKAWLAQSILRPRTTLESVLADLPAPTAQADRPDRPARPIRSAEPVSSPDDDQPLTAPRRGRRPGDRGKADKLPN